MGSAGCAMRTWRALRARRRSPRAVERISYPSQIPRSYHRMRFPLRDSPGWFERDQTDNDYLRNIPNGYGSRQLPPIFGVAPGSRPRVRQFGGASQASLPETQLTATSLAGLLQSSIVGAMQRSGRVTNDYDPRFCSLLASSADGHLERFRAGRCWRYDRESQTPR